MPESKTLAFAGLRPHKLPWGFDERHPACLFLKIALRERLIRLIEDEGVLHFISGMAMGIDQICAEIVLALQPKYPDITLEAAIPCKEQDKLWPQEYRERYRILLDKCAHIHAVSEEYTDECMEKRNRYMADKCDMVLAVWNGKPGGMGSTMKYARKQKKPVIMIDPFDLPG
jgi:uncharacterized phage-like protein YoqJ